MEVIEDREIHGELLTIDNKRFIRCKLVDCILEYSGSPVVFDSTHMQRCRYVFFDEARSTVRFLQGVGLMQYTPKEWAEFTEQVH